MQNTLRVILLTLFKILCEIPIIYIYIFYNIAYSISYIASLVLINYNRHFRGEL